MEAVGKIAEWLYQLCMAHCLHLAVTDVIYAKNSQNYELYIEPCDRNPSEARRTSFVMKTKVNRNTIHNIQRAKLRLVRY